MNSHTVYQQNIFKFMMNQNDRDNNDMNDILKIGDVSSGYGSINSHNISRFNE